MEADGGKSSSNSGNKVTDSNLPNPPPEAAALGSAQWEQIMLRFDTFEKSIQATIKEEIKINSVGIQKQVKSLSSKVKEVEKNISGNKTEIAKINDKIANFDNIQEVIAAEVQKQVSNKMVQMEKNLEKNNSEVSKIKKDNEASNKKAHDSSTEISQREFLLEKCFTHRRNLMLMGLEEPTEGEDDERKRVADLLQNRLGVPRPKFDMAFRMGASTGNKPKAHPDDLLGYRPTLPGLE